MDWMSQALLEIREKYGSEAAQDVERLINEAIQDKLLPQLVKLQQSVASIGAFNAKEMIPAGDLQKKSFRAIQDQLKEHPRLLLLYNSAPSAVILNIKTWEEIEEQLSATIAVLSWEAHEGRDISPKEFWNAFNEAKPKA